MRASGVFAPDALSFLDRRALQRVGVYLAGAWTFFQFVQWLVDRYVLSPHLVDLCLLVLLLMLPTVLLLAPRRRAEAPGWTRAQRLGVPCNLLGVAAAAFFLFGGKDLGSAQTTVTVTDEDGQAVERIVPKSEFRKRVALFAFETGDDDTAWMGQGVPEALGADLSQDLFVSAASTGAFAEDLRKAGFDDGRGVPLALQREIAKDHRLDYVLGGKAARTEGGYRIATALYRTDNGKLLEERVFEGADFFALVDKAAVQLKRDLEIPASHIEAAPDLPAAEVLTASLEAFQHYVAGAEAFYFENDFEEAAAGAGRAVEADPTFAFAHLMRAQMLGMLQQEAASLEAFRTAAQHEYRLPERFRYVISANVFFLSQQPDEALRAAQQWHTLYPDDVLALQVLAQLHGMRDETDEAIAARRKLMQLDAGEAGQRLAIGNLLLQKDRYEEALREFEAYVQATPDDADGHRSVGKAHARMGDLARAADAYRQALVVDAGNLDAELDLAHVRFQMGARDEAFAQYEEVLRRAQTPRERWRIHSTLASKHLLLGRYAAYRDALGEGWAALAQLVPPAHVLLQQSRAAHGLVQAGRADEARALLQKTRALPVAEQPLFKAQIDLAEARLFIETGRAAEAIEQVRASVKTLRGYGLNQNFGEHLLLGEAHVALEAWDEAAVAYEAELVLDRDDVYTRTRLGDAYHAQGAQSRAEAAYREALRLYPAHPRAHLGLAKVLLAQRRAAEARPHLEQALTAWAEADPGFEKAEEAKRLLSGLAL